MGNTDKGETTVQAEEPARPRRTREPLLDLWRGLALIDMAWVHLATYSIGMPQTATAWVGDHSRFAAGCFVLLSGLTIRTVFGSRLAFGGEPARQAVRALLRRAVLLAVVDRATCVAFAAIESMALDPSPLSADSFGDLVRLAAFGHAGVTGGLLILYSFLLVATPLLERARQRAGAGVVLLSSLLVFALATAAGSVAHWPPWTFPLAHWQPLFVTGYLSVPVLQSLRASGGGVPARWCVLATAAGGVAFALRNGRALGWQWAGLPALDFTKVPLSPAELGWYLASSAFVLVWSARLYETSGAVRRGTLWICRMGQWSLLVYVAHLLLELPIIAFLTRVDPSPAWRTTMLPLMAAALSAVAVVAATLEDRMTLWGAPKTMLRRMFPPAGTAGIGVVLASLASVLLLRVGEAPRVVKSSVVDTLALETADDAPAPEGEIGFSMIDLDDEHLLGFDFADEDDVPAQERQVDSPGRNP